MIKAILFDIDNTLIDFIKMKEYAIDVAITAMQDEINLSHDEIKNVIYDIYAVKNMEHDYVFQETLEKLGYGNNPKILSKAIVAYRRAKLGNTIPYPTVKSTLMKLKEKGLIIGVITDAPSKNAWIRLTELGLEDFFEFVITFDDTGVGKSSTKPFELALSKMDGIRAEQVLFIGDNANKDIKMAKTAGLKTIFAAYGHNNSMLVNRKDSEISRMKIIEEFKPDYVAYKFSDIIEFID